jgi:hypothetical protein
MGNLLQHVVFSIIHMSKTMVCYVHRKRNPLMVEWIET